MLTALGNRVFALTITPNTNLPGLAQAAQVVGSLMTGAIIVATAAIVLGGAAWGWGNQHGNIQMGHTGRKLVEGGLIGAFIIGAAGILTGYFQHLGMAA